MRLGRLDGPKTREIVAKALMRSKLRNTRRDAEEPYTPPPPRPRDSLLLVATVAKPASVDYDPAEATGIVGKDVELLECQGCEATTATLEGMLRHCISFKAAPDLRRVHNHIVMTERCNRSLGTMLITAYGKCGLPDAAVSVFRGLRRQNEQGWTAAIVAMAENGRHRDAFNLFRDMILDGSPPLPVTYTEVLKACGEMGGLKEAKLVHFCLATSRWRSHLPVVNQLIDTYDKVGAIEEASKALGSVIVDAGSETWKKVWGAYKKRGQSREVLKLFLNMDPAQQTSLNAKMCQEAMNACSSLEDARALHAHLSSLGMATEFETARRFLELFIRLGSLKDAEVVFQSVKTKNLEWWQTMIRAYAAGGDIENVRRLYRVMKSHRMSYNKKTQAQILESCKTKGKLLSVEAVAVPA
ncbi:hypothetical protein SELMODRAFT_421835 [Selaginella moellendorffii]|uniref:Pentacotripeptide-repeat region of PRORP domain-containing protein n=1 Tax=Selaginella moellendorffii TaxID=88036 RepID=D8SGI2_SELML|nr:pentatricopeptide repeat-containing protein At2g34400 [Selaginella moellendorffii]EFJ16358.1 hypothetical protein SELMODRAFT_421835 [Selaginella moellendorffii]|eukprot:XP_002982605.1 pentatricopeptide repeat-containing protein At2g34400 [Selaginella moellendorffii]